MKLHGIHSIQRKNLLISYRREYTAQAQVSFGAHDIHEVGVEFSLELSPLGTSTIRVKVPGTPDFPTMPIISLVKEEVHRLDHAGELP